MRLGEERTRVQVGDVEVEVVLPWGQLKALLRAVSGLDAASPATLEAMEQRIRECIVGVRGLQAPDGTPVEEMTAEVWDALPARFVADIVKSVLDIGGSMGDETFRPHEGAG